MTYIGVDFSLKSGLKKIHQFFLYMLPYVEIVTFIVSGPQCIIVLNIHI